MTTHVTVGPKQTSSDYPCYGENACFNLAMGAVWPPTVAIGTIHFHRRNMHGTSDSDKNNGDPQTQTPKHSPEEEEDDMDSGDEALLEVLGLASLSVVEDAQEASPAPPNDPDSAIFPWNDKIRSSLCEQRQQYEQEGVVILPLRIPDSFMRRITDEIVWSGGDKAFPADKSYETIRLMRRGEIVEKRTLTRLENFVNGHPEWKKLCDYLGKLISEVMGKQMVLYKEKLNIKPPGGSGFAPHLDTPSLRIALGKDGPQSFVTVMVAIDSMTVPNGCLRVVQGNFDDSNCVETIQPNKDGNPDADGRAGAIPTETADTLQFTDITCSGGTIAAFSGFVPHRSAANQSPFSRRAVFLTYNPASEGDFHDAYYEHMECKRNAWRAKLGLNGPSSPPEQQTQSSQDQQAELDALATIPRI